MARRRDVLRWGLAGVLGLAAPGATVALANGWPVPRPLPGPGPTPSGTPSPTPSPPVTPFTIPLTLPPVARPTSTDGGVDRYDIRQRVGRQRILPGVDTEIWGYEGVFPGPTIEARRGRPVEVTHHNELPVPTVVHLHGAVAAPEHDGYPTDLVLPADGDWEDDPGVVAHRRWTVGGIVLGSRTYVYPNDQPAATLWYHDHRMGFSGPQQYRGLAGFYLLRDEVEDALPLPSGERELPLMLADRTFDADGSLFYPSLDPTLRVPGVELAYHHSGMLGDTVTVNGVAWPYHEVKRALYRLRLVNAANARVFQLELDPPPPDGQPAFVQIGSDLGLLPRPQRLERVVISPGERYDLLVDFSAYPADTQVTLLNTLETGLLGVVMRFVVGGTATDDARIPERLAPEDPPPPPPSVATRTFSFLSGPEGTGLPGMINMQVFHGGRTDAQPTLGSTEIWDLTADPQHPIHLHLARFRVLQRDGGPPAAQDAGWKDTVFVPEGGVRVAVTFEGFRGRYVFHCHNLEHSDAGMMANMDVV